MLEKLKDSKSNQIDSKTRKLINLHNHIRIGIVDKLNIFPLWSEYNLDVDGSLQKDIASYFAGGKMPMTEDNKFADSALQSAMDQYPELKFLIAAVCENANNYRAAARLYFEVGSKSKLFETLANAAIDDILVKFPSYSLSKGAKREFEFIKILIAQYYLESVNNSNTVMCNHTKAYTILKGKNEDDTIPQFVLIKVLLAKCYAGGLGVARDLKTAKA